MTRVALLWHMHQPFYQDLVTGEHMLPWVRLHALKDYYGMIALLREFPDVRLTFNLVPSLLVQLQAFADDRARDRYLDLSLKPADALDDADVDFMLENFFHAQRHRMIDVYPRYAELLGKRGPLETAADRRRAAAAYSRDDLRDLQVLHKLAWIDPFYLEGDARVRALVSKARAFTEDDKQALRAVELELLRRVVPEYAAAAARGQVELSTSPFFHPILPLLCDTDIYLRTHPEARRPRRPFVHPEDAAEQLARATAHHQRLFGSAPTGVWPSEGSVSDAMVPLVAAAGFGWMATDEQILGRTLGVTFTRDGNGRVEQADRLYQPYRISAGGASVSCLFRDHVLSDLIGFAYASWSAEAAAEDFAARLADAGRAYRAQGGRGDPVITIVVDGENAWEHFEGGGRPFLRALYRRLSSHPEVRTVTMAEACAAPGGELATIFPGSWIDANFYIWIGHADDQRAWSQLGDARDALERAGSAPDAAAAREEVLIAEGSDWFWWYGDDHSSAHDLEFDDLFRRHLRNAYRLLGQPVPDDLYLRNISTRPAPVAQTDPSGFVTPTVDGEDTSYFEWLGAGAFLVRETAGAMHRAEAAPAHIQAVRFGFDPERLYVRVDTQGAAVDLLAGGLDVALTFLAPDGLRFVVRASEGRLAASFWTRDGSGWVPADARGSVAAAATSLEVALPWTALGVAAGEAAAFVVTVLRGGVEVERQPGDRPLEVTAPDAAFTARHWSA